MQTSVIFLILKNGVTDPLKKRKNKNAISEETYNKLKPIGSKLGTLYGSAKVHKLLKNGLPTFRTIFQQLVPPTHKLAEYLASILSDTIQNEFTAKDSFTFADEILSRLSDLCMDIDALFTNIPLDETVDISKLQKLFFKLQKLWLNEYLNIIFMIF